jgi:hypothetical protein
MDSYCNCADFQSWSDIYFTHLFTTLGQISAVLISGTVAVPMVSYYSKGLVKFFTNKINSNQNFSIGVKASIKNENEECKKAFKSN